MTIVLLLVVIVILLYTHRARHEYTLGVFLLLAAFTLLAIQIHLLRILGELFALALQHWIELLTAFSGAMLLIVPAVMLYVALRDHTEKRPAPGNPPQPHGAVRSKFERRVATLMALGYGRTQAEMTALGQMKRDLQHLQREKLNLRDPS
ncbi:MAG: hypothetical protein WBQ72_03950 [Terriglobales bacterium]|jgi:hypothetical protein